MGTDRLREIGRQRMGMGLLLVVVLILVFLHSLGPHLQSPFMASQDERHPLQEMVRFLHGERPENLTRGPVYSLLLASTWTVTRGWLGAGDAPLQALWWRHADPGVLVKFMRSIQLKFLFFYLVILLLMGYILGGWRNAYTATVWAGLSSSLVHGSHTGLEDLLTALCSLAFLFCVLLFLQSPRRGYSYVYWWLGCWCLGVGAAVKYNALWVGLAGLAPFLYEWRERPWRDWLYLTLGILSGLQAFAGSFFAWSWDVAHDYWTHLQLMSSVVFVTPDQRLTTFFWSRWRLEEWPLLFLAIIGIGCLLYTMRRRRWFLDYTLLLAIAPAIVVSFVPGVRLHPHYFLPVWGPLVLLAAYGVWRAPGAPILRWMLVFLVLVPLLDAWGIRIRSPRPQWQQTCEWIEGNIPSGTAIAYYPVDGVPPLRSEYDQAILESLLPRLSPALHKELLPLEDRPAYRAVPLVLYTRNPKVPPEFVPQADLDNPQNRRIFGTRWLFYHDLKRLGVEYVLFPALLLNRWRSAPPIKRWSPAHYRWVTGRAHALHLTDDPPFSVFHFFPDPHAPWVMMAVP